jgi:hypothetical protein
MRNRVSNDCRGAVIVLAGFALSACGGGSGDDVPGPDSRSLTAVTDYTADFRAMQARLSPPTIFNTAFLPPENAIPASGSATFTGFANVSVAQAGTALALTGPATVAIDFGTRNLTGSASGFSGIEGPDLSAYAGTVDFRNGRIGRDQAPPTVQQPNDVRFDYEGVLVGDGNTVGLDGSAAGKLKGSPIRGLTAVSGSGETVTLNGAATPATFTLLAESD